MSLIFHSKVLDKKEALDYYENLNFKIHIQEERTFALCTGLVIELSDHPKLRSGLTWIGSASKAPGFKRKQINDLDLISDPDGVLIYFQPCELTSVGDKTSKLGAFSGISLECFDLRVSQAFYQQLGYRRSMGSIDAGWITLSLEGAMDLSLMQIGSCPHHFINPSLTFFNGNQNLDIIDQLESDGIPILERLSIFSRDHSIDNVVLATPGNLGIFVFND